MTDLVLTIQFCYVLYYKYTHIHYVHTYQLDSQAGELKGGQFKKVARCLKSDRWSAIFLKSYCGTQTSTAEAILGSTWRRAFWTGAYTPNVEKELFLVQDDTGYENLDNE